MRKALLSSKVRFCFLMDRAVFLEQSGGVQDEFLEM